MGKVIPLKDPAERPPHRHNKAAAIILVLLALLLLVGIGFVIKSMIPSRGVQTELEEPTKDIALTETELTTLSLNPLAANSFAVYGDSFVNIGSDALTYYKANGEEDTSLSLRMSDPLYRISGSYLALSSRGGKDVRILRDKKQVDQITTDQPVTDIAVNSRGYCIIVTEDEYYKNKVSVRNNKGEELFSWLSADGYVVKCDLSADGKKLYVATLNSGEEYYCEVIGFSIYDTKPLYRKKYAGRLFVGGALLDSGEYLALLDNRYVTLNDKGVEQKSYSYPASYSLKTYDIDTGGKLALNFTAGGTTHILLANTTGFAGEPTDISLNGTVAALSLSDNDILVATNSKLYLLGSNGDTKKSITLSNANIEQLLCYANHKALAIRNASASIIPY